MKKQESPLQMHYDKVRLEFGYRTFLVPRAAAFHIFELLQGEDVYEVHSWWRPNKTSTYRAVLLDPEALPKVSTFGPAQWAIAVQMQRIYEEEQEEKERTKNAP